MDICELRRILPSPLPLSCRNLMKSCLVQYQPRAAYLLSRMALSVDENDADALAVRLASLLFMDDRGEEMKELCERVRMQYDGGHPLAWLAEGCLCLGRDLVRAIDCIIGAVLKAPADECFAFVFLQTFVHRSSEHSRAAEEAYRVCTLQQPRNWLLYVHMAMEAMKPPARLNTAETLLTVAVQMAPFQVRPLVEMARLVDALYGPPASLAWLQLASLARPSPSVLSQPLSSLCCTCRPASDALPRLAGISPDAGLSVCLGYGYLRARCFSQAATAFADAIRQAPHFTEGWEGLGKALLLQGRETEANHCFGKAQAPRPSLDADVPRVGLRTVAYLLRAPGLPVAVGGSAGFLTHCMQQPSLFSLLNYATGPVGQQVEEDGEIRGEGEEPFGLAQMIRRPFTRRSNLSIDPSMPPPSAFTAPPAPLPEFVAPCPTSLPTKINRRCEEESPTRAGSGRSGRMVGRVAGESHQLSGWYVGGEDEDGRGEEEERSVDGGDTERLGLEGEVVEAEAVGEANSARMLGCDWGWRGRKAKESLHQKHDKWRRLLEEGCDMETMQRWIENMEENRLDRECLRFSVREIVGSLS
eukprot:GHVS01027269.1.p1 GENE.GHVS01027269.1~~GHVS01027269.1.p1  ORF type:complete len:586 (+),score=81.17 GHVS01027269.1:937-2694(+)